MKKKYGVIFIGICAVLMMTLGVAPDSFARKKRVVFGGGPAGGTFQTVANAIQVYKPVKEAEGFSVKAQSSAGSVENLRKVNSGKQQMATVYSGHVYLGRNGKMKNDPKKYENVLAVAYLYGAPAQLVTKAGSGIKSVKDLVGKKVGVGNAGSGAFANCELFFAHMGVWDKIERNAMGYNDAAAAFGNNQLDAFWLFTACPSGAVVMAAQTNDIDLIDLNADAESSGFYDQYPYFAKLSVPGGTYKGVARDTPSFQDSALWVANAKVPDEVVYELLSLIYTDEGLAHMRAQKKTFKEMSVASGINGIVTPLHPGAIKFWKEKGVLK
jgi:TRAP transporter TAXI family solute receptor